jgi:Bacterial Ig-like domain
MKGVSMRTRITVLAGTVLVAVLALSGVALAAGSLVVTKTVPSAGATGVAPTANIDAYFNQDVAASTVKSRKFKIRKKGTTTWLPATRSVDNTISPTSTNGGSESVVTLNPDADLAPNTIYQVVIVGGTSGVKGVNGEILSTNKRWTFTTAGTTPIVLAAPTIISPQENAFVGASFTLSGTAEPNATVEIFEGTTSKGTTQADGSGLWSKALSGVSEGTHTYTVRRLRMLPATPPPLPTPAP